MGNSDGHPPKTKLQAMDQTEWQEACKLHSETQSQLRREAQAERSKASTARARAILERLKNDLPTMHADIAERRERREMFGEPEIASTMSEPVMNAAQRQVRSMYEQQQSTAPVWDAPTEARWNAWFD